MKINKFSLTYLTGMGMIIISGFFPFLGYRFTMKDYQDVKDWFPLLNLKKLADRYQAMGDISLFARILPYLAILTGIAGIVLVVIYLRGDRDTWNIFNLTFFIPAVLSGIELFWLTHSKTIRAIHDIMKETTRSMRENGYNGFAGYRMGFYLFLAGVVISLISAVCFFALDRE